MWECPQREAVIWWSEPITAEELLCDRVQLLRHSPGKQLGEVRWDLYSPFNECLPRASYCINTNSSNSPTTLWSNSSSLCADEELQFREIVYLGGHSRDGMARVWSQLLTKSGFFLLLNCFHLLSTHTVVCLSNPHDKCFGCIIT